IKQILPFIAPEDKVVEPVELDVIFEPTKEYIMGQLIPLALETFFYEMLLENAVGEHGARMTSMHQATENAIEINKDLKLLYNKARQAAITNEILEIVSGAEALKG
ncbi:MAG TPA: F0F1 ATP synthase subunit gamma, partial [Bacteroidales bacterium]|nr:F0F1 ATP synthase subunit gamma [Bacteroidales bacterium]